MIEIGKRYRHYKKGSEYLILAIGRLEHEHLEGEEYVVYQAIIGDQGEKPGLTWIRPRSEFESNVEWNGEMVPRFSLVE